MPKSYQTYKYKAGDSPAKLAEQFETSPNQILNANQGGYPFNQGQTIKIPKPPRGYQGIGGGQALPGLAPTSIGINQQMTNALGQTWSSNPFRDYNYMDPAKVRQRWLNSPSQAKDPLGFLFPKDSTGATGPTGPVPANATEKAMLQWRPGEKKYPDLEGGTTGSVAINGYQVGQIVGSQIINGKAYAVDDGGQRIDPTTGQIAWSPSTATTDIYGGQFQQAGQTKFMRNKAGKIQKFYLGKDNQWHVIKRGGGGGGGGGSSGGGSSSGSGQGITQVGLVNFNAGAG